MWISHISVWKFTWNCWIDEQNKNYNEIRKTAEYKEALQEERYEQRWKKIFKDTQRRKSIDFVNKNYCSHYDTKDYEEKNMRTTG